MVWDRIDCIVLKNRQGENAKKAERLTAFKTRLICISKTDRMERAVSVKRTEMYYHHIHCRFAPQVQSLSCNYIIKFIVKL